MQTRTRLISTTTLVVTASLLPAASLTASAVGPGVCTGVARCHVVARADIDGDGDRDAVGVARRGRSGAPEGAVIVRVKTGPGDIAAVRRPTASWQGPLFQGVAGLDGRRGREIVVGATAGAHAQLFRAITWRHGDLVVLPAPGRGRLWYIDGAVWISAGWHRRRDERPGLIRERVAERVGDATRSPFRGRVTTFRWRHGSWDRVSARTIFPMSQDRAYRWGGFRVPGLDRW